MKFSQLNNDILNILQSSDYNLYLELYNDECNTVMDKDETRWCYINDYNIMIKLPSEFDKNVTIIKNGDDLDNKMKRIISRMRKISVLNGVSVQIKVYNELDRRKIYNFIKTDIKKKKENMDMKESFDKSLITKTFYKMLKTAKQTNRSEDYYISESLKSQKNLNLLKEMICEVQNLESLKGVELNDFFASFLSCSSLKEIKNLVNKTSNLECVYESLDNINNLTKFVRSRYVNMGSNHKSSNTLFFMENVKVYTEKIMLSEQDVAYSILLNKSNGNVSYNNLLKIIKENNLCEDYNCNKRNLIDMVFKNKKISSYNFVIEDYLGNKIIVESKYKFGIKSLANYLKNGGSVNDEIYNNILYETLKYDELTSFLKKYHDSYILKEYNIKLSKMLKNTVRNLSNDNYTNIINETLLYEYDNKYDELVKKIGFEHPAIKYLAIEETKVDYQYSKMLFENNINDISILTKNLRKYVGNRNKLNMVVETIMKKKIHLSVLNDKNPLITAKNIFENLSFENDFSKSTIASSMFSIIHNKPTDEDVKYIKTISKYIL